ncbi:hypothetical protein WDJ51_05820 [Rathayibacter sp. YIM 133350]|uniref:hypothetical protein n=1 Tax=Rathayibacter sp. YIM 133350 TaxID=3131992 RepID=UPI00307D7D9F
MPRSNRPSRGRGRPEPDDDLGRLLAGFKRTETKRDGAWNVQPVSAEKALKPYVCPGCSLTVEVGTAHVVAWRADALLGDAAALADRRHWHTHCWRIH